MSGGDKTSPSLTIDRAAFLLLRVKKAFKKKKQQRCKDKSAAGAGAVEGGGKQDNRGSSRNASGKPAPLLRSRTLPAIVAPGLNILQAQIDARYAQEQEDATIVGDELALLIPPYLGTCTTTNTKRNSTAKAAATGLLAGGKQLLAPRISFTDDQLERRVSDTGPNYRRGRAAGDAAGGTTGGSNKDHPHSYRGSSLSAGSGGSSSQPLSRLAARLLNQRPSFIAASTASAAVIPSDELPRRLSWERRKCSNASTSIGGLASSSCLARSSSIDSVAECWSLLGDQHYQQLCEQQQQHKLPKRSPSPLLGATSRLDSRLASVASSSSSSSATPRASRPKGHRALIGGGSSSTSPGTSSTTSLSPAARAGKVPDDSSALLSAMVPKDLDTAVRLERVTPRDIAEDLEAKLHIGPAKTASKLLKIDELSIKNSTFSAYENPTFVDSSFDSSVSSFFYEDDESDQSQEEKGFEKIVHEKNAKMKQQRERQWKEQPDTLTVVYENGQDRCNSHRNCCTRTNAKVSGKKNFFGFGSEVRHTAVCKKTTCKENLHHNEQQASQFSKFYVDSKSGSCEKINDCVRKHEALSHKRKGGAKKNLKLLGLDFAAVGTKQRISLEHTSEKKLHSLRGMEFLEGFGKKKQQLQRNRQCQINNNLSAVHVNPLAAQSSLNIHLHALFAAVENGNLDKARAILESTDVDINSVNSDGLSPLDVSVLSNNRSLSKMLVSFGAQEGNQFTSADSLGSHLALLLSEAEHRVQELSGGSSGEAVGFPSSSLGPSLALGAESTGAVQQFQPPHLSSGMPPPPPPPMSHRSSFSSQHNLTGCGGTAEDKQLALWERRARALRKMLYGFDQARPPDVPFLVTVDVTGVTSVTARFQESELCESFICTKFKIQWSTKEDFSTILGERELLDVKEKECSINNLIHGQKYYFRAAAGNIKGYSRFRPTTPAFLTPSSWRDVDSRINRFSGRLEQIDSLMVNIRGAEYSQETPALQRRNHKKKTTIKQLFTATSKFQKNLRRGVYLACLIYHEDKILVTNEDFLPVIEVDETYPSCIQNDYNWLIKVASTWDDLKSLKQDMEKCHSSSSQHFRIKLLQAAIQMQTAFGIQDLGQLFHKPIRDIQGTLVFSVINSVKSPKSVSMLNSRWLSVAKVTKKIVTHEDSNVADILMASIQSQINYHQVSSIKLNGGLYIGYLKMQSSVDSIQVVVPTKSPNFLPHCKIRDNSHVSAEEWECLKRVARMNPDNSQNREVEEKSEDEEKENVSYEFVGTEQQKVFIDQVALAAKQLFSYMDINTNESHLHRIYDMEVIDLNDEVSFLVAVPPAETACSVPGTREILLQRSDLLSLPIQVFEMVHLNTYQKELINRYSRLSLLLELDTAQAQHSHREAFSNLELTVAKDKLTRLQDLQTQMNSVWKGARWLVDLITFARDRGTSSTSGGINIKNLLSLERNRSRSNSNNTNGNVNTLKRSLLQLPPRDPKLVKASPGRGSWPGPSVTNSNESSQINLLSQELSKSEQQLPLGSYPRKGSNSSNCSSVSEPYKSTWLKTSGVSNKLSSVSQQLYQTSQTKLPPSRSEDTLLVGKYKQHQQQPLVSRSSASSATTSPLLGMKLSVKSGINSASESAHSVSSEECPALSRSKLAKPTASVAAIADKSNSSELSTSDEFSGSQTLLPGILQVYAAYETGLASGTSLKLHVTGRTTAREVVDLVVKQLNMAVVLKGLEGPVYAQEELQNFCLVAVIGARERCLRDDFKPLQLQNPWKKGRLYVRQKQDVLAALEHSSKHTAYL